MRTGVRKTSFSPPDQMGSPIFSPIVKERISARKDLSGEEMEEDKVNMTGGEGELYQTAEIGLHHDSPEASMDIDTGVGVSQSQSQSQGWTMSLQAEDETGSKDTGYGTHTASITNLTPSSPSSSRQEQETCGPAQSHGLMSYNGGDSNDISVGFPLGSSTPTKK